jgi:hypothetical protein
MQIIILEYDVRYNNVYKENLESEFKLMNENYHIKEDEANFLRNRFAALESGADTEELFYQEINKIRGSLREKTNELIKLDQFHNQTHNENKDKVNQFKEQNLVLIDENGKLKEILKDILGFHSNGQKKDLENLLIYLQNDNSLFNENNKAEQSNDNTIINNQNNEIINAQDESESKEFSVNNNNANNSSAVQKEEFTEKVLNEFDKIFNEELKRVERFFKKDSFNNNKTIESLKRKSSIKKKGSAEKNYFEWKSKSQYDAWAETLRGRDLVKKPSQPSLNANYFNNNNNNNQQPNLDIEDMVEHTKNKLRKSLKSYENLNLIVGSTNNLNSNFNFMSSYTTKNILGNNNNNFNFGRENSNTKNNFTSRNLNNMHLKYDNNSYNYGNNQLGRNNSISNISSGIKSRVNQSQSPNNRNASMKHSSSKRELKGRE